MPGLKSLITSREVATNRRICEIGFLVLLITFVMNQEKRIEKDHMTPVFEAYQQRLQMIH